MALNPGAPMPSSLVSNTQGRSSSTLRLQLLSSITWSLPPTKSWSWRAAADCLMSLTNPLRFIIGQNHSSLDGMKLPQLGAGIIYKIGRGGERKEREEEAFMEQIIALLSRAEATRTPESIREDYKEKKYLVNVDIEQEPLESFRCPLTREVMQDPVSIATGSTFERENIEEWFASGNKTDPTNGAVLVDLNLKPNYKIRECIEEWIDWNHCFRIQNARRKLESGEEAKVNEALDDLCKICKTNKFRHWIAEEKLIKHVVEVLKIRNDSLRRKSLSALQVIVIKNEENKVRINSLFISGFST